MTTLPCTMEKLHASPMEKLHASPHCFRFMGETQREDWSFQMAAVLLRGENLEHCREPSLGVVKRALPKGAEFIPDEFRGIDDVVKQLQGLPESRWTPVVGGYNLNYNDNNELMLMYCPFKVREGMSTTTFNKPTREYHLLPHLWYRKEDSWTKKRPGQGPGGKNKRRK